MKRWLVFLLTLAFAGCHRDDLGVLQVNDFHPSFQIDPTQPFTIEFGRGNGLQGLETIELDQTGMLVVHRIITGKDNTANCETSSLQLPPEGLRKVLQSIDANGLMKVKKAYEANVADGNQWIFWISQGDHEKMIYCSNYFPQPMKSFAEQLDRELSAAGLERAVWQPIPEKEFRARERKLWDSVKRYGQSD